LHRWRGFRQVRCAKVLVQQVVEIH
jgi:hypothetical protein